MPFYMMCVLVPQSTPKTEGRLILSLDTYGCMSWHIMTFREKETFKTAIARAFLCSKVKNMLTLSFAFTIYGSQCPNPAFLLPSKLKKVLPWYH